MTIAGHLTIYRCDCQSIVPAGFGVWLLAALEYSVPEAFGPSHALKRDYENAQTVHDPAGGDSRRDPGRVLNDVHENSRRF